MSIVQCFSCICGLLLLLFVSSSYVNFLNYFILWLLPYLLVDRCLAAFVWPFSFDVAFCNSQQTCCKINHQPYLAISIMTLFCWIAIILSSIEITVGSCQMWVYTVNYELPGLRGAVNKLRKSKCYFSLFLITILLI